jgi:hypothetical protein
VRSPTTAYPRTSMAIAPANPHIAAAFVAAALLLTWIGALVVGVVLDVAVVGMLTVLTMVLPGRVVY